MHRGPLLLAVLAAALACSGRPPAARRAPAADPGPVDPRGHALDGIASWYGPGFAGKATASGETYDPDDMTCAHRTLPFGVRVLVRNLDNDRTVWVRVNDRGPFVPGRVIDLSHAAARAVEMVGPGTARVHLTLAGEAADTSDAASPPIEAGDTEWFVQVGAFGKRARADAFAADLRDRGHAAEVHSGDDLYRVRLGPFATRPPADERAEALRAEALTAFVICEPCTQ